MHVTSITVTKLDLEMCVNGDDKIDVFTVGVENGVVTLTTI